MNQRAQRSERGVVLPPGHTGSSLFHAILIEAVAEFPDVLRAARVPSSAGAFKRDYGDVLARLEAERIASPRRVEIARFILRRTQRALQYAKDEQRQPLAEYLAEREPRPALQRTALSGAPGLRAEVPFEGKVYRGREVHGLVEQLADQRQLTRAAQDALRWSVEHIEGQGGLDLRGQRFVLLGAGAELAPARMLLAAGAELLWIDLADPARALPELDRLAGALVHAEGARNLLEEPRAIAAAIDAFAAEGPVHVGMFAYASGASQEWRLGAAMNAIVGQLDPASIASVSLLVSPTTAATLQPEDVASSSQRLADAPMWQGALMHAGLLPRPGYYAANGVAIARSTVSIQGLSYQAAQYISKLAAAETLAVYGNDLDTETRRPITVSANVAGITRTRSLEHPLFQAAFIGAAHFGVRIFDADTTRALSGLLILHDLLNPQAPGAANVQHQDPRKKAAGVLSQQVHGGIYGLPYVLDPTIRMAALIGMGTRPSLLLRRAARPAA